MGLDWWFVEYFQGVNVGVWGGEKVGGGIFVLTALSPFYLEQKD